MYFWIPFAFVRIVVFFVAGILIGIFAPFSIPLLPVVICFLLVAIAYCVLASVKSLRSRFNPGLLGLLAIFFSGLINVQLHKEEGTPGHLSVLTEKPGYYKATIVSYVQDREKSWKAEASVSSVKVNDQWLPANGKVLLYFSKSMARPLYGDVFVIKGNPVEVKGPMNPGEFDYMQFLAYRNIHHQDFIKPDKCVRLDNEPPDRTMNVAIRARLWADGMLTKFVEGEREQGIASALVLGITDGLDHDLMTAYGATGTLHVLAVSGLHISIIYMIIGWLLTPIGKSVQGKWIIAVISIVVLWGYAFITGLSPSVLRAVTMFTFVALAKPWKQKVNIYNALAASAFLLLLADPYMIMSVGFQLSYIAVLGIVYLQPRLYAWWEPESRILDEIWKVTSVSIAAQIATLPLGLLYFHQFPNYFLVSNLLVIPASFVVLIAGLIILVLGYFSVLGEWLGFVVTWMVKLMNWIVFTIEKIPFSKLDNIVISPLQALVMALMIICFLLLFELRKFYYVWIMAGLVILFSLGSWWYDYKELDHQRLLVYHVPHHSAIDLMQGSEVLFLGDTILLNDPVKTGFHIQPGRTKFGVLPMGNGKNGVAREVPGGRLVIWNTRKIYIMDERISSLRLPEVDYLIISKNAIRNLKEIEFIQADKIILDSSNSFYLAERLLEQGVASDKEVYSVAHQGAYNEIIGL